MQFGGFEKFVFVTVSIFLTVFVFVFVFVVIPCAHTREIIEKTFTKILLN